LAFWRHGRALWWSLAASLVIHGIALGGLILFARPWSADLPRGEPAPGAAASGGPVLVRLLGASAARGWRPWRRQTAARLLPKLASTRATG
jgi:hypothetical protein